MSTLQCYCPCIVNVLKFWMLFSFCSQINVGKLGWNPQNASQNSKQGRPWSDCFFISSLSRPFDRQLLLKILEHLQSYSLSTHCDLVTLTYITNFSFVIALSGNMNYKPWIQIIPQHCFDFICACVHLYPLVRFDAFLTQMRSTLDSWYPIVFIKKLTYLSNCPTNWNMGESIQDYLNSGFWANFP